MWSVNSIQKGMADEQQRALAEYRRKLIEHKELEAKWVGKSRPGGVCCRKLRSPRREGQRASARSWPSFDGSMTRQRMT